MRDLFIIEDIDWGISKSIIEKIVAFNSVDDKEEKKYVDYKREPIKIWLCSYGGIVAPGVAIYNTIEQSKTPVHIIVIGVAFSISFILLFGADKVIAKKPSRFMYHEISSNNGGFIFGQNEIVKELQDRQDIIDDIIINNSKITKEKLLDVRSRKSDWYINPEEALKLGVIDEII